MIVRSGSLTTGRFTPGQGRISIWHGYSPEGGAVTKCYPLVTNTANDSRLWVLEVLSSILPNMKTFHYETDAKQYFWWDLENKISPHPKIKTIIIIVFAIWRNTKVRFWHKISNTGCKSSFSGSLTYKQRPRSFPKVDLFLPSELSGQRK